MSEGERSSTTKTPVIASYKEEWRATIWENLKVNSVQLATLGGAAAIARTSVAPLERVKILLQTQSMSQRPISAHCTSLRGGLHQIVQQEGRRALYRGNGANVVRVVPEIGLMLLFNEQLEILFSPTDGSPPGLQSHIAAGAMTGILQAVALHPLDLAHTRLAADAAAPGQPRAYKGLAHCLLTTGRLEGWRALYKGVLAASLGSVPCMATAFTVYHELNGRLPTDRHSKSSWWFPASKLAIGASASMLGQAVAYPIDTVRRRMQLSGSQGQAICYSGYWHCIRGMLQREGLGSFYRGVGINCLRVWPGAVVQFVSFDVLRTGVLALRRTPV